MNNLIKLCAPLGLVVSLTGCVSFEMFTPDPPDIPGIEQYSVMGPVKVNGMEQKRYKWNQNFVFDYQTVASSAAIMLQRHLDENSRAINQIDSKTIRTHISSIDSIGIIPVQCIINFVVETDDGYRRGHQASGQNRWNFAQACNDAISEIVVQILSDKHVRAYLES